MRWIILVLFLVISFYWHVKIRAAGPVDYMLVKERNFAGVLPFDLGYQYDIGGMLIYVPKNTPMQMRLHENRGKKVSIILRVEE